jgi:hypothetical protein
MSIMTPGNCIALVLLGVILVSGLGCKAKNQSSAAGGALPPEVQAAQRLPEGTNILAALEQKDYEGVVAGLAKIQPVVGTGELAPDYLTLKMFVKGKLVELAPTDPKAAEALNAVRALTKGG